MYDYVIEGHKETGEPRCVNRSRGTMGRNKQPLPGHCGRTNRRKTGFRGVYENYDNYTHYNGIAEGNVSRACGFVMYFESFWSILTYFDRNFFPKR